MRGRGRGRALRSGEMASEGVGNGIRSGEGREGSEGGEERDFGGWKEYFIRFDGWSGERRDSGEEEKEMLR